MAPHQAGKPLAITLFCGRDAASQTRPTAPPPRCSPRSLQPGPPTPFLLPGPLPPGPLLLLQDFWWLTTHLRTLEATVRRKSSERTPRPRPSAGAGAATSASTSRAQPGRPASRTSCPRRLRGRRSLLPGLPGALPTGPAHPPPPLCYSPRPHPGPQGMDTCATSPAPVSSALNQRTEDSADTLGPCPSQELSGPPWARRPPQPLARTGRGPARRGQLCTPQTQARGWPGSERCLVPGEAAGTAVSESRLTSKPAGRSARDSHAFSPKPAPSSSQRKLPPTPTPAWQPLPPGKHPEPELPSQLPPGPSVSPEPPLSTRTNALSLPADL